MTFKKFKYLRLKKILSAIALAYLTTSSVNAGFFSSGNYNLPLQKSMLISPFKRVSPSIKWTSSNPRVATVDNHGVVHAKSRGVAEISAYHNSRRDCCKVTVTEPEAVRSVYTNIPKENERLIVYAMTPRNAESVKFIVTGPNYYKEICCGNKSTSGENYIWQENVGTAGSGTYTLSAYSKIGGDWKNSPNSKIDFTISEGSHRSSLISLSRKNLSRDGMNFIIRQEGFGSRVYVDIANCLTIGCGRVIYPGETFYDNCNKQEAYQDFLTRINKYRFTLAVNNFLVNNKIAFNQYQFDALVSFSYNLGKGWLSSSALRNTILSAGSSSNEGTVNAKTGIYLRSGPGTNHKRISSLYYGNKVSILGRSGNWYHVRTRSGATGYCCADYVSAGSGGGRNLDSINRHRFISEFSQYHHAGRKCIKGLLRRRLEELEIFFHGNYNSHAPFWKYPTPPCFNK